MKTRQSLNMGIVTILALALFSFFIPPSDNGWRGPNRDGKVTGFEIPQVWPEQLTLKWQVPVGLGDASPVISEGKIYLHTLKEGNEVAICIEAITGKIIWEVINNKAPEVTGGASSHPGPRSTPAVTAGKVFNVGAGGNITCRDAMNGSLFWESHAFTSEVPQFFVACSPLITDNKCILHLMGRTSGAVIAFHVNTGSVLWKLEGEPSTYSSPLRMNIYGDVVVLQGETSLFAVSATKGELLWKIPTPTETRFYNSSTPVIDGKNIYIGGQGSGFKGLEVSENNGKFEVTELWKNPAMSVSYNTPVLKNGYLFGNEARFGYLFCLNAATGEISWADTTKHNRFASVQDLGSVLASLPATGQLIIYKPDAKKYSPEKIYKVAETEVYAHPVFFARDIYIKDKEHLSCWATTN